MNAPLRLIGTVLLIWIGTQDLGAQQYFFQTFGAADGLPVSTVNDIEQDPLGFIWIATEGGGLVRFDGRNAHNFTVENGLPSNYVTVLKLLGDSAMIVGTDKGSRYYDGRTLHNPWPMLPDDRLVAFHAVSDTLYFAFRRSLWMVTDTLQREISVSEQPELFALSSTMDGHLLIGSASGLLKREDGALQVIWSGAAVRSICRVDDFFDPGGRTGGILYGAADDVYYTDASDQVTKLTDILVYNKDIQGSLADVRDIVYDGSGRIWLGSYRDGLLGIESVSGKPQGTHIGVNNGLSNYKIRALHISDDSRLWIGALSGMSQLVNPDLYRFTGADGLSDERIHALYIDPAGSWWMGGVDGLSVRDPAGSITRYSEEDGFPRGLVFDIEPGRSGSMWIATELGLVRKRGDHFQTYGPESGLANAFVFDVQAYPDGSLALATSGGIYRFANGRFSLLDERLSSQAFTRLQLDSKGRLWALDLEGGLMYLDGDEWTTPLDDGLMSRLSAATFAVTPGNVLWIGTNGNGLWRWDGQYLDSLQTELGLLSNNVWSVLPVGDAVWIGTELGVQKVSWKSGNWQFGERISEARGFGAVECNQSAIARHEESIVFGTNEGLLVAPVSKSEELSSHGRIQLLALDLFFQQPESWELMATGQESWSGMPRGVTLPFDQNYLRFRYSAMSVADPAVLVYEYRMQPLSEEWTGAGDRVEAIYTSVPPGKYTFEVRAFDPMSGQVLYSRPYSLEITPPFWRTLWFYALLVIFIAGSIYIYIRLRLRRMHLRMKLEAERNDLERRALRLQMNPHFVFNALDAISGFIFKNEPKEAVKYLNNFAKLMRLTLESSREHFIPLHTEVQLLENYLALERLRFSGEFESEIVVQPDLDPYGVSLPSMMVQPHIENAILHGLRARGEGGRVRIVFSRLGNGIRCVIEDNGIGRQAAAIRQEKSARNHQSLAGAISRRRLELFEKSYGTRSSVLIEDLYSPRGKPAGTRVTLLLPVQLTDEWSED